jgi:membrane protease YdiL (CAAX protease family)
VANEPRKISAKTLVADIRAGLDDPALMAQYSLSEQQLNSAFKQLIELGVIGRSDLDGRTGVSLSAQAFIDEPHAADDQANSPDSVDESGASKPEGFVRSKFKKMLRMLANTDQPVRSYVWRAWLISIVPTLFIGIIAVGVVGSVGYEPPPINLPPGALIIVGLFFAPFEESFIMWPILWFLKLLFRKPHWVALASAVIWGVLHGLHNVAQGVVIIWAFFVLSLCFLAWEKKSKLTGIGVTALVHMCHNTVPTLAFVLLSVFGGPAFEHKAAPCPKTPPAQIEKAPQRTETLGFGSGGGAPHQPPQAKTGFK